MFFLVIYANHPKYKRFLQDAFMGKSDTLREFVKCPDPVGVDDDGFAAFRFDSGARLRVNHYF